MGNGLNGGGTWISQQRDDRRQLAHRGRRDADGYAPSEDRCGTDASRAPTLRTGTLQAWWAGEQARQVERLEQQAKRQLLAGDSVGAERSARRADSIRNGIDSLASFEKPATR